MGDQVEETICPPGAIPQRTAAEAGATEEAVGESIEIGEEDNNRIRMFVSGKTHTTNRCIIVIHDAFGYNSARTHHVAAEYARRLNCLVVAPDLFDGLRPGCCKMMSDIRLAWPIQFEVLIKYVLPWIRNIGKISGPIGAVGFCSGGWATMRFAETTNITCGVAFHPSLLLQSLQPFGEPSLKECVSKVTQPLLFFPTSQDPGLVHPGGWVVKQLEEQGIDIQVHPIKQSHGYMNRGDIRNKATANAVEEGFVVSVSFFEKYLIAT